MMQDDDEYDYFNSIRYPIGSTEPIVFRSRVTKGRIGPCDRIVADFEVVDGKPLRVSPWRIKAGE